MKAVVDTNVVAYLLLGTPGVAEQVKAAVAKLSTALAPAHWEAEVANVLWMAVRANVLTEQEALGRLGLARRLGIESVAIGSLCHGALLRSLKTRLAAYDTLFVELAIRAKCPLLTYDKAILKAFPDVAIRPTA